MPSCPVAPSQRRHIGCSSCATAGETSGLPARCRSGTSTTCLSAITTSIRPVAASRRLPVWWPSPRGDGGMLSIPAGQRARFRRRSRARLRRAQRYRLHPYARRQGVRAVEGAQGHVCAVPCDCGRGGRGGLAGGMTGPVGGDGRPSFRGEAPTSMPAEWTPFHNRSRRLHLPAG